MKGLKIKYQKRFDKALVLLAKNLEEELIKLLEGQSHIDKVSVRAKSVDRFIQKSKKTIEGKPKYSDPYNQIQDQIGARIVTFYLSDVGKISKYIRKYYKPIEVSTIVPDSEKEFGYFGFHFILLTPPHFIPDDKDKYLFPTFFEMQIVTLFQHAWAEAEHDLGYKPEVHLSKEQYRKIAFTAAQAWGSDIIFDELLSELTG
jgi:putative GTP pyrophosphokinase